MKKSSYLSERVYDAIPSEINMESLEYWKKILKEEGLQYVKKNHLEYFFGFINNCAFSSHEKSQPRNFVKLSLNKKAFRHEGEKMVFGAFYDPFVQEANRQLREIVIQRRYINESILFDFQQFLFNSLNNLCIRTLIYEMHICGQEGVLRGNESEQYQYYIDHFLKDKQYLNDLFSLYPVLERRINEIIQNAIDIYKEVIERIEKDADVLMKKFNITEKGFVVNHLSTDFSDSHKKGRRVFCVEFVSGDKILYKPRSLQNEIKLQEITNYFYRICNLGSYEYSILDKEMYGWCEIVIQRDCKSIEELSRYYQRIGIILFINYAYICFSLLIKADFNAVICAVLLLLLIWAMDYLFSLCFKKNDLGISEKKRYIFMAYVGACISGFIIASRDASKMALEIPNITISVLIGAYVPFTLLLEDGKKGKVELQSMKEEWEEKYKKTFRERKVKDILSALLFAMVYGVLLVGALSPAQNIINDIASGIGMGMATVVVAFVGLVEVKNRLTKRRNKREDADQEKSDTE